MNRGEATPTPLRSALLPWTFPAPHLLALFAFDEQPPSLQSLGATDIDAAVEALTLKNDGESELLGGQLIDLHGGFAGRHERRNPNEAGAYARLGTRAPSGLLITTQRASAPSSLTNGRSNLRQR